MTVKQPYNLFRRKGQRALCCAVRQDKPVPAFLHGEAWDFDGTFPDDASQPAGFRPKAARQATSINGYYLFQALGEEGVSADKKSRQPLAA